jgi:CubicO group peptidase (beta-lactamase class C family)
MTAITPTQTMHRKTFRLCATALLLLTLFLPFRAGNAQSSALDRHQPLRTKVDKHLIARMERTIPHLMTEGDIPGLSVALISNARLTWSRSFGVKNAGTKEAVDNNTVFEAASLSKPVFAYAVLKLVDSGKIDLDTPLTKYLPGRYDVGDDPRLDQITARRVLSHTTGFPNWRTRGDPTLKIHFTPGDRFSYSGEGFVYLARVVEHLTGETLDVFMKRTVLKPLGMSSSSFVWLDNYESRKTFTHNSVSEVSGRDKPEKANAAASLHTTATDYARFVVAVLKGEGLKPATLRLMLNPQVSVAEAGSNNLNRPDPKLSQSISWGLGWGLEKTDDGMAFWHWGDNGDTKAFVRAFEKQKTGLVMFANSTTGLSIVQELVEQALGGQHPSVAWANIESYNHPARVLFKAILNSDAQTALADYRQRRQMSDSTSITKDLSLTEVHPTAKTKDQSTKTKINSTSKYKDQSTKIKNTQAENNVSLTESQMNRLGYQLLRLKRIQDAIEVFKQNTLDFPNEFNTWDSLAEGYMISGDKESAIKYYKKSLELNPDNTNAVQKLKELGG